LVDNAIVGLGLVLQQTPFADIVSPPVLEITPPELAVELVIAEINVVVMWGINADEGVGIQAVPFQIQLSLSPIFVPLGKLELEHKIASRRTAANFRLHYVKNYVSGCYSVEVWLIKNNTNKPQEALEKTFFKQGDLAISLQSRLLAAGDKTYLYVLRSQNA
jgi:hypothetical protein